LAVGLRRKLYALRSIFSTAPYLGLLGTCFGIMDSFGTGYSGSPWGFAIWSVRGTSAALLSTAAGILVAITATGTHNYLRTYLDSFENMPPTGCLQKTKFVLRPWLAAFPFPLIAVPFLAAPIAAYMIFPAVDPPKGLRVHLMAIDAPGTRAPSLKPILIAVVSTKPNAVPIVYVNSKKTGWDELENTLQSELRVRPPNSIVYVHADSNVFWQHVMYVIDVAKGLHSEVVLLTIKPDVHRSEFGVE
jgi:biopolymer transport protein ExbD